MKKEVSTSHNIIVELKSFSQEFEAKRFADDNSFTLVENLNGSPCGHHTPSKQKLKTYSHTKDNQNRRNDPKNKGEYRIIFDTARVSLVTPLNEVIYTDFVHGELAHRRKFGGGKGQMIAKAVGLNKGYTPNVLDATAGLGSDAFVLACLGCKVTMIERSIIARLLLQSGLQQAQMALAETSDNELSKVINRMTLIEGDSLSFLEKEYFESLNISLPEVIYLDPMFPVRKKKAEVKKGMKAFHELIGSDEDAAGLLSKALEIAEYRVVVKRPRIAPFLADKQPSYQLSGKSSRFDIYTKKALPLLKNV